MFTLIQIYYQHIFGIIMIELDIVEELSQNHTIMNI